MWQAEFSLPRSNWTKWFKVNLKQLKIEKVSFPLSKLPPWERNKRTLFCAFSIKILQANFKTKCLSKEKNISFGDFWNETCNFYRKKVTNFQLKLFPNCCMNSQVVLIETVSVFFSEWNSHQKVFSHLLLLVFHSFPLAASGKWFFSSQQPLTEINPP